MQQEGLYIQLTASIKLASVHVQVRKRLGIAKDTIGLLLSATTIAFPRPATVQPSQHNEDEDMTCVICLDQPSSTVFHPCSHCVTCNTCAQLVLKAGQACPLCRGPVESIEQ